MFTSLRSRLWLSYALLILVILAVVGTALVIALLRNPAVYQSAMPRLRLAELAVLPRVKQVLKANPDRLQAVLERDAETTQLRLLVVDLAGNVVADSSKVKTNTIANIDPNKLAEIASADRPGIIRDVRRRTWLYTAISTGSDSYLVVAIQLPKLPVLTLLRNEVISPILISGTAALLISIILALSMAKWIATPLQRMVGAAHQLAAGKDTRIAEEGPDEVRDLARSLNYMNRQMRAGQQAQRDFVANVSHELKTPLTSIQGFAQAILDGAAQTPEALQNAAGVIYQEANRMHRLVLDLLALAKMEGGTADFQAVPVNISELLRAATARFVLQASKAQINLICEVGELPKVTGDGDRLAQVFNNLIENALKFTPAGGTVTVRANPQEGSILVEVADTGLGIAEADRERIFERFYQTDKSRRGGGERGVGLGLPIARQIVLAHGGKMWVEGQSGPGSCFLVKLPTQLAGK
jgi:two-component system OmpR family sensor kinase